MDRPSVRTADALVPAERRRHPRSTLPQPAVVDLGLHRGATLLDVSEGGIGVQAPGHTVPGVVTSVSLTLPGTLAPIRTMGTVAWSEDGRMGLELRDLRGEERERLARWAVKPHVRAGGIADADKAEFHWHSGAEAGADVQRVAALTGATGIALAMERTGDMVCVATWGNAPGLNTRLDPHTGLSGECVRTGEMVRCEDTESDPRIDRLLCRRLNLRSILIVPVKQHGRVAGVIEAFSNVPHHFESPHVALLRRVADLVANVNSATGSAAAPAPTESPRRAAPAASEVTATVADEHARPAPRQAASLEMQPPAAAADARPPEQPPARAAVLAHVAFGNSSSLVKAEPVLSQNKSAGRRRAPPPLPQSNIFRRTAGALRSMARSALVVWFTTVLLLAGVLAYRQTIRVARPEAPGVVQSPAGSSSSAMEALSTRIDDVVARVRALIQGTTGANQGTEGSLSANSTGQVSGGQLLERVEPVYPEVARKRRLQGPVILRLDVGKDGRVERIEVLRGNPLLASAAKAAVRRWRYDPFRVDGQAINMQTVVSVPFAVPGP